MILIFQDTPKKKAGIQQLIQNRTKRKEERKFKESRNFKPRSKDYHKYQDEALKSKWMDRDDFDVLKGNKILKTYYKDSAKRKQKDFNIKIKRHSREQKQISVSKPREVVSSYVYK